MSALVACQPSMLRGDELRTTATGELAALARYGSSVRTLDPDRLEQEYVELSTLNQLDPSNETTIKLSLLLSSPLAPFHDQERAIRLLNDVALRLEADDDPNAAFPRLIYQLLTEQSDLVAENEALRRILAQERERNESLTEQLVRAEASLETATDRTRTLQQQLDALKALEEQLDLEAADQ